MRSQPGFTPHVARLGEGPRLALALHCSLAFSGAWKGLARAMEGRVTLVAPDMPSHGKSVDWDGTSSFADTAYVASLACLTEPMDVIGHSFGAATALRLAVERPDLVRSLTVIEPVKFSVAMQDAPASMVVHDRGMEPVFAAVAQGDHETAARLFNRMWSAHGPRWADMPEAVRGAMTRAIRVVPDTAEMLIEDSEDILPRLGRAGMPALAVHGSETWEPVKVTNAGLVARLGDAQLAEVEGAGHMAAITHPSEVAQLWSEVLDRADAA